jgi:hypothetical protein
MSRRSTAWALHHDPPPDVGLTGKQIDSLPILVFQPPTPTSKASTCVPAQNQVSVPPDAFDVTAGRTNSLPMLANWDESGVEPVDVRGLLIPHGHGFKPALSAIPGSTDSTTPSMLSASASGLLHLGKSLHLGSATGEVSVGQASGSLAAGAADEAWQASGSAFARQDRTFHESGNLLFGNESYQLAGLYPDTCGSLAQQAGCIQPAVSSGEPLDIEPSCVMDDVAVSPHEAAGWLGREELLRDELRQARRAGPAAETQPHCHWQHRQSVEGGTWDGLMQTSHSILNCDTSAASEVDAARLREGAVQQVATRQDDPAWQGGATQFFCVVCLEDYNAGEAVKVLPCGHRCSTPHASCRISQELLSCCDGVYMSRPTTIAVRIYRCWA